MSRTIIALGTYTRTLPHVRGTAKGVSFFAHDPDSGRWEVITASGEEGALDMNDSPSYIALMRLPASDRELRYCIIACNEGDPDELPGTMTGRNFSLVGDGEKLHVASDSEKVLCDVSSSGPCHLSISSCGKWACAATYFGGAVVCVPIELVRGTATGDVAIGTKPVCIVQHTKFTNTDPSRQEKPHAHQAIFSPDGKMLAVSDLGGDCVILYSFDKSTGSLTENQSLQLPAGSGPRHAVFHPTLPLLYVACELSSTVVVCRQSAAEANIMLLEPSGIFSTVPEGVAAGASSCSAIRISLDGKMVFVANRGDDSIAVFEVSESPELVLKSFVRDFGSIPRDFALHPSLPILYVASQNDNLLTAFAIGPDGKATRLGESMSTPTPVCVVPFLA